MRNISIGRKQQTDIKPDRRLMRCSPKLAKSSGEVNAKPAGGEDGARETPQMRDEN